MGVTGNAVFVQSDEHGVVVVVATLRGFPALIDQPGVDKSVQHIPADKSLFEQVGVNTAHGAVSRRQLEFFFLLLLGRGGADLALLAVQETGHGFRVTEAVELLDEGDRPAALFCRVVKPFVPTDRDAMVAGKAAFPSFMQKPFSPAEEKGFQVHGGSTLLLAVCEFNIGHGQSSFQNADSCSPLMGVAGGE